MTTEPKLPPIPFDCSPPAVHAWGLQCFEAGRQQGMAQADALHGLAASSQEIEAHELLVRLRPYVDSLICYASTIDENPPNGLARDVEVYFATYYGPKA